MKSLLLASTVLFAFSGVALAADAVSIDPLPEAGFSWTGGYIGLQAGYSWGDSSVDFPGQTFHTNPKPSGFLGGIYGGYNYQLPSNLVLGIDADVNFSGAKGADFLHADSGATNEDEDWKTKVDWTGSIRGRVGYALDRTLIYAAGGVAFAGTKTGVYDFDNLRDEVSSTRTGWTLGVGAEHAFTDNLVARIEYRYADFGTKHYDANEIASTIATDIDLKTHDLRIGLAYKF